MRKLTLFVILLLISGCATQRNGSNETGTQIHDIKLLKSQLKKDPVNPDKHYKLGLAYAQRDSFSLAIAHYDTALSLNPALTKVKVERANLLLKKNRIKEGYAQYLEVLKGRDADEYTFEIARQIGQPYPIRQLTKGDYNNAFGYFSPDGERIVFQSDRDGSWDIFMIDKADKQGTKLTENESQEEMPVFSPDGKSIAFTSTQDDTSSLDRVDMERNIYVMNLEKRTFKSVVSFIGDDWYPAFTKDEDRMVFTSEKDDPRDINFQKKLSDIYLMDTESGIVHCLTQNEADDCSPVVTRNGKWIYFTSNRDGNFQIYKMNTEGGETQQLTFREWNCGSPHLSHDEKRIVFFAEMNGNYDIYMMNTDGQKLVRLTHDPAQDAYPCFSPDEKRIIFHSNPTGKFQIYWIDLLNPLSRNQIVEKLEQKILEAD
ncbi:DUF5050 domain-containing protein [candidate division KSB1 bacterium]|nr:DUF5050 domain-containing protein [candidate division KSB1 bacterium]